VDAAFEIYPGLKSHAVLKMKKFNAEITSINRISRLMKKISQQQNWFYQMM
jgi:hypothetical protein